MNFTGPAATSFYTPFWAGIQNDWYRNYDIDAVWKNDYDLLVEQLVAEHAPYIYPFADGVLRAVDRDNNTTFADQGRSAYYILTRAYQMPGTREKWLEAVARENTRVQICSLCETGSPLLNYHPEIIREYGTNPPWCRSCNYVVRRYSKFWDSDTRILIAKLLSRAEQPRKCEICGTFFDLKNHIFTFASFGRKFVDLLYPNLFADVCPNCFNKTFADRRLRDSSAHLEALVDLAKFLGKVPSQDLENLFYLFKDKGSMLTLISILQRMRTPSGYKEEFGSFFAALVAAAVLPTGSKRMQLGTMTLAMDGHVCLSIIEKEIDDFLFAEGIAHDKEVYYPDSRFRADWELIGANVRTFVEYFGLMNIALYATRAEHKRQWAIACGIELIELVPSSDWKQVIRDWKSRT